MGPGLYDIESGESIAPENAAAALAEGRLGVDGSRPLTVVSDSGRRVEIPAGENVGQELGKLLATGFRIETPGEAQAVAVEDEAAKHPYLALGEAALRGATLGLSSPVLDATLGDEYTEGAAARRNVVEGYGTLAEVGGALVPALASGGALGYTPAGLLTRGAETAGAALERSLLARGVGQGVARVAGMAAEGTLDGAVSSMGAELSEATLGNTDVTAERLLAAGGFGALLGLGGGVAGAGLAAAARKGGRSLSEMRAARAADAAAPPVVPIGSSEAGLFELVPDSMVEAAIARSPDGEILRKAVGDKSFRAKLLDKDNVKNDLNKRLRDDLQASLDTDHLARGLFAGGPKRANVLAEVPTDFKRGLAAKADFQAIKNEYAQQLEELNSKGWLKKQQYDNLKKELAYTESLTESAFGSGGVTGEGFLAIENLKRAADARRLNISNSKAKRGYNMAEGEVNPKLKEMSTALGDRLRKHLENQGFYGEAARKQAERNAAGAAVFGTNQGLFRKLIAYTGEGMGPAAWDEELRVIDGGKMDSFLSDVVNPNKEFDVDQVRRNLVAREKLLDTVQKNGEIPDDYSPEQFAKAHEDIKRAITTLDEAKDVLGKISRFEDVEKAGAELSNITSMASNVGKWVGGAAGFTVAGPMGAAVGGTLGAGLPKLLGLAVNPGELVRTVGRLEALSQRSGGVAKSAQERTVEAVRRLSKPKADRRVMSRTRRVVVRDRAQERERARKVESRLTALQQDPQRIVDALAYQTRSISDVAPATAMAYQQQMAKAVGFLRSKLPPSAASANLLQPTLNKSLWDSETIDKFGRYLDVLSNPASAVDALESGKLTEEHVEALKAVYPSLYQEMREAAAAEIATHSDEMPFDSVVQLSLLLDIEGHPTMSQSFQATLADVRKKTEQEAQQNTTPPSQRKPIEVKQSFVDRLSGGLS
jgi:hypothetical protein